MKVGPLVVVLKHHSSTIPYHHQQQHHHHPPPPTYLPTYLQGHEEENLPPEPGTPIFEKPLLSPRFEFLNVVIKALIPVLVVNLIGVGRVGS